MRGVANKPAPAVWLCGCLHARVHSAPIDVCVSGSACLCVFTPTLSMMVSSLHSISFFLFSLNKTQREEEYRTEIASFRKQMLFAMPYLVLLILLNGEPITWRKVAIG